MNLERLFGLRAAGTSLWRETLAGTTTFLTMAYILFVNPVFLTAAGMPAEGAFLATALGAAIGSALMGLIAGYPIALAPGMGLNAFFAFGICKHAGVPWEAALGLVFWTSVVFLLLTATGVRRALVRAIPPVLQHAAAVGIGLFIAFIGLQQGGLVVRSPDTFVALGNLHTTPAWLTLAGLGVTVVLMAARVRTAVFWGMLAALGLALAIGAITLPDTLVRVPSFELPGFSIDLLGALRVEYLPLLLTLLFFQFFDTLGTLMGVAHTAGLVVDGQLPRLGRALVADACGSVAGALVGTSTVTAYIESGSGVAVGGRTGLTAVVVSAFFLVSLFFAPLVAVVGQGVMDGGHPFNPVTAPALIAVGTLMVRAVRQIDWEDPLEGLPAFFTIVLMPLSFGISHGLAAGVILYVLARVAARRSGEVHLLLYVLAGLFVLRYALLPV